MAFNEWYDWAMGDHDQSPSDNRQTWRRVAEDARHDRCYEDAACGEGFRDEIGARFDDIGPDSFKKKDFKEVCRHNLDGDPAFQRQGATVRGALPDYLTRAITIESLAKHVKMLIEQLGQASVRKERIENQLVESAASDGWICLSDAMGRRFGGLSVTLAYPESERVFATLTLKDDDPPEENHSPQFWEEIDDLVDSSDRNRTRASVAAKRLALDPDPNKNRHYVLLYYDRSSLDSCRYPTPPDAEFFPHFRPVNPDEHDYGRTCPPDDGEEECNEDLAVPEVVHSNPPIDADHVWIRSLGPLVPANA